MLGDDKVLKQINAPEWELKKVESLGIDAKRLAECQSACKVDQLPASNIDQGISVFS